MPEFVIPRIDDFHVHFRSGSVLKTVVPETVRYCARALAMPNVPVIETTEQVVSYRDEILQANHDHSFEPLMTIKLTHRTTPDMINRARRAGVVAAKLYPSGVTTASYDGIYDPDALKPVFQAMSDSGMVLCIHGEDPASFILDREKDYLEVVGRIVDGFPSLRVVLEHITTIDATEFVQYGPRTLAATVTAHHLIHTLDDVLSGGLHPHHFCYPVPKRPIDRRAIAEGALNCPRIFFGSDTAPHLKEYKESACGCAGVFSAPVALSVLADVFLGTDPGPDDARRLIEFTSQRGADFYRLPRNVDTIRLMLDPWTVPASIGGIVPLCAGDTVSWRVDGHARST